MLHMKETKDFTDRQIVAMCVSLLVGVLLYRLYYPA